MTNATSDYVVINDVSPRDGLQNQTTLLEPNDRVRLIEALLDAGVGHVEVGSFVSPKAVPAMAGTDRVVAQLSGNRGSFSALIPNAKGYELAMNAGLDNILLVIAVSETMNQQNVNMSVEGSLDICSELLDRGKSDGKNMIVCLATAWECPFEGVVDPYAVAKVVHRCVDAGAQNIVLADTIGAADPVGVKSLLARLIAEFGSETFACHFHDTRGFGVANVYAAIESGVRKFDASVGGLGGCPFAPGASGNVATEDVVLMLQQIGMQTGIELAPLVAASDLVGEMTGVVTGGNASRWLKRQIEKDALPQASGS